MPAIVWCKAPQSECRTNHQLYPSSRVILIPVDMEMWAQRFTRMKTCTLTPHGSSSPVHRANAYPQPHQLRTPIISCAISSPVLHQQYPHTTRTEFQVQVECNSFEVTAHFSKIHTKLCIELLYTSLDKNLRHTKGNVDQAPFAPRYNSSAVVFCRVL